MAVGARQGDIMQQFLIEAVLVCLIGGLFGISLAFGLGFLMKAAGGPISMMFSTASIIAAFGCCTLIGVGFGYVPARNAARLDPVDALARE
jgi:macrolide transport system ATP-binding/permease protein